MTDIGKPFIHFVACCAAFALGRYYVTILIAGQENTKAFSAVFLYHLMCFHLLFDVNEFTNFYVINYLNQYIQTNKVFVILLNSSFLHVERIYNKYLTQKIYL